MIYFVQTEYTRRFALFINDTLSWYFSVTLCLKKCETRIMNWITHLLATSSAEEAQLHEMSECASYNGLSVASLTNALFSVPHFYWMALCRQSRTFVLYFSCLRMILFEFCEMFKV